MNCNICPRGCNINRKTNTGFCKSSDQIRAARAALHFWEEPCISGSNGSGAIFFSGCNMRCIFCQNYNIAANTDGIEISVEKLSEIMLTLQAQGANNINLVTPTHFTYEIIKALELAKNKGLVIPIVYNTSSYEKVETLKDLDGLVDVYLPDFKYVSHELSKEYSNAPDYFEVASAALAEMYRQRKSPVFFTDEERESLKKAHNVNIEDGILKSGIVVRHLCLPGSTKDSKAVIKYLYKKYGDNIFISIMNQYTPLKQVENHPKLHRKVTKREYDSVIDYALDLGLTKGFTQDGSVASESFIPEFDYRGIL
ncbi:radical SAM protein [Lachnospira multipara]|uniref:radical SAM protein n=1 Tax=Lachnospira multipara TaxID=28051 RepID=UPI0004055CBB|nr:radical SAM protein [Lachnospira multipara]